MNNPKTQRVYAFIDSQNLNITINKLGWKIDWRKFRKFLEDKYGVTKAFMFIGYVPEFQEMYEFLHDAGYSVVLKPTFDMSRPRPEETEEEKKKEPEEKKPVKGNIDAELVLWAMKEISNYDKAVIISGDGDFYCLVEYLQKKDRLLKLLTPSSHYSRLFTPYKEYIQRVDQFRRQLSYYDRKKNHK
jgi:uncharacterized LabA/DUF88 family protein